MPAEVSCQAQFGEPGSGSASVFDKTSRDVGPRGKQWQCKLKHYPVTWCLIICAVARAFLLGLGFDIQSSPGKQVYQRKN